MHLDYLTLATYTISQMIIDLHTHTTPLSPCSYLTPEELIQRAKESGLDGICLTEHDKVWSAETVARLGEEHDFLVLRGMEVTTNTGHVLVFGLDEYSKELANVRRLREVVNSVGGAMILAHPARHRLIDITHEDFPTMFDAIEILNGGDSAWGTASAQNTADRLGLKGTGGSDSHSLREIGLRATEFPGIIRDEKDLIEALKGNGYLPKWLR